MGSTIREQVIAVVVACAAGLLVLLVGGGGGSGVPVAQEAPARPSGQEGPAGQDKPAEPAKPDKPAEEEKDATYSPDDPAYAYEAELPSGGDWSEPHESYKRSFDLLRTTVRNSAGTVVVIDRTPNDIPAFTGDVDSTRTLPHPTFGEMTEYVFRFSTINPACLDDVCVDYLVDDGEGGGWGVLVGNVDIERAKALAERTADSLSLEG